MGPLVLAWLETLGLTALSIGATCLFVFAGARPRRAYYVVAIACFGLSHGVLLSHSVEWWRGAMWEMPFTLHFSSISQERAGRARLQEWLARPKERS